MPCCLLMTFLLRLFARSSCWLFPRDEARESTFAPQAYRAAPGTDFVRDPMARSAPMSAAE